MVMSVVVSVIFGFILLVAVTFAIPSDKGALGSTARFVVSYIWTDLDGHALGRVPALHRRRRAVLLHDRVDDVGVADDVRVLARPRRAGPPALAAASRSATAFPSTPSGRSASLAFLTPLPALWYGYVGYAASTAVAVIGLYIAFVLPIILRLRAGDKFERGAWQPRPALQVDRLGRDPLDRVHLRIFMLPRLRTTAGSRGTPGSTGTLFNYTLVMVGGRVRPLRRLVRALGQELVQGPDPAGHRGGARADRGRLRRRSADRDRTGLAASRQRNDRAPKGAPRVPERRVSSGTSANCAEFVCGTP